MIEVDFFWTFAIGAHFAVAAARQIKDIPKENKFINKYFITLVLFMALFFGATGMVLMWNFPHWETMQVFAVHGAIPLWLILLWFVTNITLPILAYAICWYFIKKKDEFKAHLMWVIGYFIFFFILVYGWDGTGFQRFFYDPTMNGWTYSTPTIGLWNPSIPVDPVAWLTSNVAITLYILGAVFLPPYLYFTTKWAADGMRNDPDVQDKVAGKGKMVELTIGAYALIGIGLILGLVLASAGLGWAFTALWGEPTSAGLVGIAIVAVATYFLGLREGMPLRKFFEKFMNP